MKGISILQRLGIGIYTSIKRYPVTLLFSASASILLIIISEMDGHIHPSTLDTLSRITMAAALGIPLSLCARAVYERKSRSNIKQLIIYYVLAALIQLVYYFTLLKEMNMVSISRWMGINLVLYLCFLFIPYLLDRKDVEMHVIHLFTRFLITYVYSGVLFTGLAAILFATDHLLGLYIKSQLYYYTFLMVSLVFAPAYFLAYVPKKEAEEKFEYSKVLKVLLFYIVLPLLTAYTFILYLYFGKIIITMEWPSGLVSHLVLWYALILTIVLFFITPIYSENKWSTNFSKWSPRIVLPILIMMFISMGIRIHAYGFTENRYYVLLLGLWIFATMVYLSLAKNRKNIFLLISLSFIILLSVAGPVSSFAISKNSQYHRLENLLIENNLLEQGEIKGNAKIPMKEQESISNILLYFDHNHTLKEISFLPEGFQISQMKDTFGFPIRYSAPTMDEYFYYATNMSSYTYDISDYEYMIDARDLYANTASTEEYGIKLLPDSNILAISLDGQEIHTIDLSSFIEDLYTKYGNSPNNALEKNDWVIEDENQEYQFKIILQNIGGQRNSEGKLIINEMNLYVFLKEKV